MIPLASMILAATVTVHVAVFPLEEDAVMVAVPALTAVTSPYAETAATDSSDDVHVTVISVAFSGRILAVKVAVSPSIKLREVSLIEIPVTSTMLAATVTLQVAVIPFEEVAMIFAEPAFTAVTSPFADTVATDVSEDVHVTVFSVASEGLTVAVSVAVSPSVRLSVVLLRVTLSTGVGMTVT